MNEPNYKIDPKVKAVWEELGSEIDESLTKEQAQQVIERLSRYPAPTPASAETAKLADLLCSQWETEYAERPPSTNRSKFSRYFTLPIQAMRLIKPHVRVLSWPFWIVSLLLLLAGGIVEAVFRETGFHPFTYVVPLLSAISVAFAFRSFGTPMFELEMTFPITPLQLIYGRLTLIIVYHCAAAAAISLFLPGTAGFTWDYVVTWLIPLGFTSLAAFVGTLYFGFSAGVFIPLFIIGTQIVVNKDLGPLYIFSGYSNEMWFESKTTGFVLTILLILLSFYKINNLQKPGENKA